jgi:hypothetical protein
MRIILGVIFFLGLIYLILPGPTRIEDFPPLPNSVKSTEPGDTYQHPNIAAYFSDLWRGDVTGYYYSSFNHLYCEKIFGILPNPICYIPPIRLNHPPEQSFTYIRDQQLTTYLEEYLYPMRESFFVNGYEPYDMQGVQFDFRSQPLVVNGREYPTKTTIRFYPSNPLYRVLVYIGIWVSMYFLWKGFKRLWLR